jgi:hypothetical protein
MRTASVSGNYYDIHDTINDEIKEIESSGGLVSDIKLVPIGQYQTLVMALIMYHPADNFKRMGVSTFETDTDYYYQVKEPYPYTVTTPVKQTEAPYYITS